MAQKTDAMQAVTEKLERGIREFFDSEKHKSYLKAMSRFHDYSLNNCILIASQAPDATLVAGYGTWKKSFERHVKRGETGIRILAPHIVKTEPDEITGEVEQRIARFRPVTVFDVSQTEGEPLSDLVLAELQGTVADYDRLQKTLIDTSPASVTFRPIPRSSKGSYHPKENRIELNPGMSEPQTIKTLIHEIAHATLHHERGNSTGGMRETEAESVAFIVCDRFGIDTSDYSFSYIAGYCDQDLKALRSSLDRIHGAAGQIIQKVKDQLQLPTPAVTKTRKKERER